MPDDNKSLKLKKKIMKYCNECVVHRNVRLWCLVDYDDEFYFQRKAYYRYARRILNKAFHINR